MASPGEFRAFLVSPHSPFFLKEFLNIGSRPFIVTVSRDFRPALFLDPNLLPEAL